MFVIIVVIVVMVLGGHCGVRDHCGGGHCGHGGGGGGYCDGGGHGHFSGRSHVRQNQMEHDHYKTVRFHQALSSKKFHDNDDDEVTV